MQFDFIFDQSVDLAEATNIGAAVNNVFFRENFLTLNYFHKLGMSLFVNSDYVIGRFDGIKFRFCGKEDFQIANEVYIGNEYKVVSGRGKVVVDIGMNAGYASLFFARQPSVVEVHSYEPFAVPFIRAQDNFDLNIAFAHKIHANHYGLGASGEDRTVLSREESTIGTSIRGVDGGTPEKITIRDAHRELSSLAVSAKARNLDFIVKMDCEGSEFSIFEALERKNVLSKIDVMMIEWHKWWSEQKTSADLIDPLIARGFTIIDRTSDSNSYAGMLYAVRAPLTARTKTQNWLRRVRQLRKVRRETF
jgi:FkbM family methyltransferase